MTVAAYPEFFNDVFGPVMQPGSSSHTAAPAGWASGRDLLGEPPSASRIVLDEQRLFRRAPSGSWPRTAPWSAASSAFRPTTKRLFRAFELADGGRRSTVSFEFTRSHSRATTRTP